MLNKPVGYTCTKKHFKNEKNIYELLPQKYQHLNSVGRLDKNSAGLLILTNDGDYLYKTTHPKFEQEKEYVVETYNHISENILNQLKQGVDIGDNKEEIVKCRAVKLLSNNKFSLIVTQGKKRQIRRMCAAVRLNVVGLKRVREGGLDLNGLKSGEWELINAKSSQIN